MEDPFEILLNSYKCNQLKSYSKLKEAARVDVPAVMSGESGAERVKGYDIPMGGGLEFNYAARPVSEEILDILQELSDEQELGAKYEALYNGERVNTGENRMVLHQLCRGQLGNDVFDGDVNKREFFVEQQRRVAEFAGKVHGGEILNDMAVRSSTKKVKSSRQSYRSESAEVISDRAHST